MARHYSEQTLLDMRREGTYMGYDLYDLEEFLAGVPAADVVPKSEYDEVLSNWQKIHDSYNSDCIEHYKYGRAEVARKIFEEIDVLVDDWKHSHIQSIQFIAELAELKKKYTEGERE